MEDTILRSSYVDQVRKILNCFLLLEQLSDVRVLCYQDLIQGMTGTNWKEKLLNPIGERRKTH